MSFIFTYALFINSKNKEMNEVFGIKKGDVYGVFFTFPFIAIGIFIIELLNSISYFFTKKLFLEHEIFKKLKDNMKIKIEKEKEKRIDRIKTLEKDFKNIQQQFHIMKQTSVLSENQEKTFKNKLEELQNEINKEKKIIDKL
jgi:hypothetical protein